ncbi:MAG TPA: sulfotransferase [Acidimicrobiales bacterium]|nr:sulfotransferase [Acidimicrobiales bacterium]
MTESLTQPDLTPGTLEPTPRPIFVIGAARSGTTLLQAMLGAHPSIAALPEMHFWFRIVNLSDHWGDLSDPSRLREVLSELINLPEGLLDRFGFDVSRLMAHLPAGPLSYASLLDAIGLDLCHREGKTRWSEKTPWQTAEQIWQLFPNAQVIHLLREPRRTISSTMEMPFNDLPAWKLAEQWDRYTVANIRSGMARGAQHYLQVRYEDLVNSPATTLGLVCSFLIEDFESSMLSHRQETNAVFGGIPAWQAGATAPVRPLGTDSPHLNAVARALIALSIRRNAGALGYEAPRRRTIAAGYALWPITLPARLGGRIRDRRNAGLSPAERYRVINRYTQERVAAALGHPEEGREAPVGTPGPWVKPRRAPARCPDSGPDSGPGPGAGLRAKTSI